MESEKKKQISNVLKNSKGKYFRSENCYLFPKHETKEQHENVFVFDLATYSDQEIAEAYAAGLYIVNRFQDKSVEDLTPDEIKTKKDKVVVFNKSCGNSVIYMLKHISENNEGD